MGLDDFATEESQSSSNTRDSGGGNDESESSSKNTKTSSEPFKSIGVGAKRKVFQAEEDWNRTVDYIENKMGFNIDEVTDWPNKIRHRALHVAIVNSKGKETEEFNIHRQCFVCGKTYNFPHSWNFIEYKESAVCGSHDFEEVKKKYRRNGGEYQEE